MAEKGVVHDAHRYPSEPDSPQDFEADLYLETREASESLREEYIRREREFDPTKASRRQYAKASNAMLKYMSKSWRKYCNVTQKDFSESLQCFHLSSVSNFFHWLLRTRKGTLRKATSLQT
jgi:hypothetical protein